MGLNIIDMGKRIAKRRKDLNIKQNVLAETLDISNNHLSCIENGREKVSLPLFIRICEALNVTPDFLLLGNMHSNNVSKDIVDMLRLCSDRDVAIIYNTLQFMVSSGPEDK